MSTTQEQQKPLALGNRLLGEIAIVTGSDSGIGRAIAIAYAKEGADVVVCYHRDRKGAEETRAVIEQIGRKSALVLLDQTQSEEVSELFDVAKSELGIPTILVNNAGVGISGIPAHEMSFDEWDRCIKTNLYGPFYCCQFFIRNLLEHKKAGSIINITSVHQDIPRLGASAYVAAKGGLKNLTATLALELAEKNITVNNIAPGMILTPMNQEALDDKDFLEKEVQAIPMKRAGTPEEIAHAAVFLASKEARYIHGTTLLIDGGLSLFHGQDV